jgi:hypothetical protein
MFPFLASGRFVQVALKTGQTPLVLRRPATWRRPSAGGASTRQVSTASWRGPPTTAQTPCARGTGADSGAAPPVGDSGAKPCAAKRIAGASRSRRGAASDFRRGPIGVNRPTARRASHKKHGDSCLATDREPVAAVASTIGAAVRPAAQAAKKCAVQNGTQVHEIKGLLRDRPSISSVAFGMSTISTIRAVPLWSVGLQVAVCTKEWYIETYSGTAR